MFTRFEDYDRTFTVMDELRRRMDHAWNDEPRGDAAALSWPKVNVFDAKDSLVLTADVPGLGENDFQITLMGETLTLSGERKATTLEGYSVQRQERSGARFSRSWTLPYPVDADKTSATLTDGVLTITLTKAADAQPRHIAVRAQS
jgi:HSP20 family protein